MILKTFPGCVFQKRGWGSPKDEKNKLSSTLVLHTHDHHHETDDSNRHTRFNKNNSPQPSTDNNVSTRQTKAEKCPINSACMIVQNLAHPTRRKKSKKPKREQKSRQQKSSQKKSIFNAGVSGAGLCPRSDPRTPGDCDRRSFWCD